MSDIALRFANVGKSYAGVSALTDLSLEVRRGECFGLVGENGAGKTTLIKCMLDFCDTDCGSIEIFGIPHRSTAARAPLAYLPERFTPPFYLGGRDFLQYILKLHRAPYDAERVAQMFNTLDLELEALAKPVRAYSKGMTQKLGLAACLLSGKDLYVLDEPTGGLDPKARALFKRELLQLRNARRTVFLTSHALADVEEMCDRLAILHEGRLRFAGTPGELRRRFDARDLEQAFLACVAEPAAAA
ncbi:MAG: ABC transporter ATP-binding protein [Betaproteobacteria bacterium RIFCSPLOWO2_12_FULL_62_13]|nr:MAG: ABC transporter ATP-binding protein [Betaproteobacteria bacterium RIFCSPLOWO2_12_FULL_62_13]